MSWHVWRQRGLFCYPHGPISGRENTLSCLCNYHMYVWMIYGKKSWTCVQCFERFFAKKSHVFCLPVSGVGCPLRRTPLGFLGGEVMWVGMFTSGKGINCSLCWPGCGWRPVNLCEKLVWFTESDVRNCEFRFMSDWFSYVSDYHLYSCVVSHLLIMWSLLYIRCV